MSFQGVVSRGRALVSEAASPRRAYTAAADGSPRLRPGCR